MIQQSSLVEAIVVDANVAVAIASKEADTELPANSEMNACIARGCMFFAPGVLVSETLYVLCKKFESGILSAPNHAQAVQDFRMILSFIQPPPDDEVSLVLRAEQLRGSYTCRRSADGLYIALAELLTQSNQTTLITFDADMQKQAANFAPSVNVKLLKI